jgi:hypothetical protein
MITFAIKIRDKNKNPSLPLGAENRDFINRPALTSSDKNAAKLL